MQRNSIITFIIEALIFIAIIVFGIHYYNNQLDISNQNLNVYRGQLEQMELKNGELISVRDSYILRIQDLENQFDMSKKEVRDLQRKLNSSLAYIAELKSNVRIDTIVTIKDTIIYKDKETDIRFIYNDDWLSFNGETKIIDKKTTTNIFNMNMNIPLKVGLSDDYQIFVQSDNPYVNFSSIEGAVIDKSKLRPKKKRWNIGVYGGFGIHYDMPTKSFGYGPQLGAGASVSF